jgi:hypothetical protein
VERLTRSDLLINLCALASPNSDVRHEEEHLDWIGRRGLTPGDSSLQLIVNTLGDSLGNPLLVTTVTNGGLSVINGAVTPEPTSILLAGLGCALLSVSAFARRLRQKSAK